MFALVLACYVFKLRSICEEAVDCYLNISSICLCLMTNLNLPFSFFFLLIYPLLELCFKCLALLDTNTLKQPAACINFTSFSTCIQYLNSKTAKEKERETAEERQREAGGWRRREADTGLAPVERKCGVML